MPVEKKSNVGYFIVKGENMMVKRVSNKLWNQFKHSEEKNSLLNKYVKYFFE